MRSARSECVKVRKGPAHVQETLKGKTAETRTAHWQQRMMDTRHWLEHRRTAALRKREVSG